MGNNMELVLRMYQEFDKGKLDGFAACIDGDFVANVLGTNTLDWDGFKQFGESFLSAFPDGRHEFDHVVTDGENVATIGVYVGTHEGVIAGMEPSFRLLRLPVMHLDRVIDGKIVEHRGLANEKDFANQLETR